MNRLFHLRETYPSNISKSLAYNDVEFVLVDYAGSDGLEEWVKSELKEHLDSGILRFFRVDGPRYWVAAHAKNIAHRMASGEILCNLDADIYIPEGFCDFVNGQFSNGRQVVIGFNSEDNKGQNGCAGMVIAKREHFYSVNGYDENINLGWGYDDMNYQFRVRMHNRLDLVTPPPIISAICHSNEVRTENCQLKDIIRTRDISMAICEEAAFKKEYVANKDVEWGFADIRAILTHSS